MLHLLLPYLNETIPSIGNISDISLMLPTFSQYRRALMQMEFAAYVYEDFRGAMNDPVSGEPQWSEVVCAPRQCYVTVNNTASYYGLAANEGRLPNNFSSSALQAVTHGALIVYREGFYINQIRSIPVGRTTGVWGVPYVWLEEASQTPYVLQPLQSCWEWNMTLSDGAGECIHSISIELNLQLLIEGLVRITAGRAESTALIHMNSMTLLSNTFAGLPLVNLSGITDLTPYQGTSGLTHRMWNAESTPSNLLNIVVTQFDQQCVMHRSLVKVVNETINVYALEYSCETLVVSIDDKIIGLKLIEVDSDSQFLFVDVTPRAYFYASVDHALRNTIIVAVVVCTVAVLVVALLFVSVSSAMRSLLDNIIVAESLDYEGVKETSMILYETQRVHDAFLALNARLLQTRAFLPQSIFEKAMKDGSSPLILPSSRASLGGTNTVVSPCAKEDLRGSGASHSTNPLLTSTDDGKCEDAGGEVGGDRAAGTGVSFAVSVVDHKSAPSSGMYPRPRRLNLSSSLASRRVTVVYGNMVGSSALFTDRGAPAAQQMLGEILTIIETVVSAQRGVIDLYHGDRVMVSFNASTVTTSSGPRAARAILQIEKAIEELDDPALPAVRWGVSTGNAVVGNFGTSRTRRFCVCGPVVNQAFALMLHCRAEGVLNLVAPLTYDLIKDDFVVEHRNFVALTMGGTVNTVPAVISTVLRVRGEQSSEEDPTSEDDADDVNRNNVAFEHLERGELDEAGQECDKLPPHIGVRLRQILGRSAAPSA
jgi:class 3 adenylate cyclase